MRAASHWSVIGPGRRGGVGPEARRPPSDHKPEALVERGGSLQLQFRSAGLAAGLLTLALAPPALAGPTVTVRVEGKGGTFAEEQRIATPDGTVSSGDGNSCAGNTPLGAMHQAVGGDWAGAWFGTGTGYFVERIRSENYPSDGSTPDGWTYWVNGRDILQAPCGYTVQEGDDVLWLVTRCEWDGSKCANKPVLPLELRVPSTARTGTPAEVTVVMLDGQGGTQPADGAHIVGPGVDATTDVNGRTTVTFGQAGQITLKADRPGSVRSAPETVAVSAPGQPVTPPAPVARDTAAPVARIAGIRSGQRFKRKRAPRTLRGTVTPDPSGLRAVKLSLTRSSGGRCQLYSPTQERFRPSRCGRRVNFSIGDRESWSYLLPKRLGKGRYVLDVIAVDKLGNRDRLARGRNRVVFFVR
jgi:hypothetical protein